MPGRRAASVVTGLAFWVILGLATPAFAAGARAPAQGSFVAAYDIYIGGIWVGELILDSHMESETYRARVTFQTTGIVGFFLDKDWRGEIRGKVAEDRLVPEHYLAVSEDGENRREVGFSKGRPVSVSAEPPLEDKPWSIDLEDQGPAVDPITMLLSMLGPAPRRILCDRHIEVFDGKHRFAFNIDPPEHGEDGVRCPGAQVRLAGYEPDEMGEDARQAFTLLLSERDDRRFRVTRIEADTFFGKGIMQIRE